MIPQDIVNRILDTAQIVDVVGDFVTLKKSGSNFQACCPFHNEKTPSFSVSPSKGIYKCFGCGKSGTAVGFVMEHESMTYVEALKYLAKKYNIEVIEKEESPEEIAQRQRYESLLLVSEFAGKFFQDSLNTPDGQAIAYQYFRSRGLEDETIRKYGLGWAPVSRRAFSEAARKAGYKEEFLIETGLSIKYDDGTLADRFYDRVMFPIHSVNGRLIAFGGRTLKKEKTDSKGRTIAKYVNSPETEIYVKSKSLYGIHFAKSEISKQDKCILVEGYLDVLSMHQLGILNVVASSGTSLTVDQIRLIHRFTDNITIIYDGDGAGIKAALRGIDMVLKEGMNVKIVLLPDGQDPDDFARKHTLEEVQEYISSNERDFIGFKTDLLLEEAGNDPLKKGKLINDIADTIALIPDAVIRAMYVRSTATRFSMDERVIFNRLNHTRKTLVEAEKKQQDRRNMTQGQSQSQLPPPPPGPEYDDMPEDPMAQEQPEVPVINPMNGIGACEEELLKFILEDGCTEMRFDRDSQYYCDGASVNVAEFIDGSLAEDEYDFIVPMYRSLYETYFAFYDEGLTQEQIMSRILNGPDREMAAVAERIVQEKYTITIKSFENSMTSRMTQLIMYVPRALMAYQIRRLEAVIDELMRGLEPVRGTEAETEILLKLVNLNKAKTLITKQLGRV